MPYRSPTADALTDWIGVRWEDARTARVTIRPELLNPGGLLSGVVAFTLVDYSMASALMEEVAEGEYVATLGVSVSYIRGATEGDLLCRTSVDRRTRSNAALRSEVVHEDGGLIATAVGTFAIFRRRR